MEKKKYNGLDVRFVPTNGMNMITATSVCEIVSVQYYVTKGLGECDSQDPSAGGEIGYSYNWNRQPTNMPGN